VAVITLRQQLVPDAMRGRIAGASRLVTWGMQPVGAVVGGVIATAFGLGAPFVFACIVLAGMAVVTIPVITPELIASATRRALELEDAVATEPATALKRRPEAGRRGSAGPVVIKNACGCEFL
jgi:hypothetical protein